jgi:hypothetical protein
MTQEVSRPRTEPAGHLGAAPVRYLALALLSLVLVAGCSTITTYKPGTAARPAKPMDYPVLVFTEDMTVPRRCEVIGTISIQDTKLTMFGGSIESEMKKVMATAREKGADAVQMKSIEVPNFSDANYRLTADLVGYTDTWETISLSEGEFTGYLRKNQRHLDPIEGVWDAQGLILHRIGIMRNTSKPGRDFVGFIFNTGNPTWHEGYKKMDIRRGTKPGTYIFDYYLDDFSERTTTVFLGENTAFTLALATLEDKIELITYSREP